jgi:hypothetical protein
MEAREYQNTRGLDGVATKHEFRESSSRKKYLSGEDSLGTIEGYLFHIHSILNKSVRAITKTVGEMQLSDLPWRCHCC